MQNYYHNYDLPKAVVTAAEIFYLSKVGKMTEVTCPKLVKVTSNFLT